MKVEAYFCDNCKKKFIGEAEIKEIWHVRAVKKMGKYDEEHRGDYCNRCITQRRLNITTKDPSAAARSERDFILGVNKKAES